MRSFFLAGAALLMAANQVLADGYNNPTNGGGKNLGHFPPNFNTQGEPLNVIISGSSSSEVLSEDGLETWANALGFGKECLGLHGGEAMQANLGDGNGWHDQGGVFRWLYGGPPNIGACIETFEGGNHLRFWQQKETNAWFLAVSKEEDLEHHHNITANGYDVGRDKLVSDASKSSSYHGKKYNTNVDWISGWLPTGSDGINHGIAIDGRTAVLTITVA